MIVIAINELMKSQNRSKKWLARELKMDYGKVKRLLNINGEQQLTISTAEQMLSLLGSNLHTVLTLRTINELRDKIMDDFDCCLKRL